MYHRFTLFAYIIFSGILLQGCVMRPWSVLNEEEMVDILYDIHLTESTLHILQPNTSKIDKRAYYDAVFEKHHITRAEFEHSMGWYTSRPKKLEEVYEMLKIKAFAFHKDVLAYKYHPELLATLGHDTLNMDTVPLYLFADKYRFSHIPPRDSLIFEIDNAELFAPGDIILWRFNLYSLPYDTVFQDSLPNTQINLMIAYNNGEIDTLRSSLKTNNTQTRRYTFRWQRADSIRPISVRGSFFDGTDSVIKLHIDSAKIYRIFNGSKYPLADSLRLTVDTLPDISPSTLEQLLPAPIGVPSNNQTEKANELKIKL